jgi:formate hydrogenlyase transcriptional activator
MVDERQFRADLFYRLSVFPIELPPLRDRREDIRLLVQHFAMDYAARLHKPITAISEEFMEVVARHSWPGNIRELQNLIERSVILSTDVVLTGSLPERSQTTRDGSKWSNGSTLSTEQDGGSHTLENLPQTEGAIVGRNGAAVPLGIRTLAQAEREHISEVLQMTDGLVAGHGGAAEVLGLPASTLRNRMKKLGIKSKGRF